MRGWRCYLDIVILIITIPFIILCWMNLNISLYYTFAYVLFMAIIIYTLLSLLLFQTKLKVSSIRVILLLILLFFLISWIIKYINLL